MVLFSGTPHLRGETPGTRRLAPSPCAITASAGNGARLGPRRVGSDNLPRSGPQEKRHTGESVQKNLVQAHRLPQILLGPLALGDVAVKTLDEGFSADGYHVGRHLHRKYMAILVMGFQLDGQDFPCM